MHISRGIELKSSGLVAVASMFHQTFKSHLLNIACIAIYKSTYKVSDWADAIAEKCRFLPEYWDVTIGKLSASLCILWSQQPSGLAVTVRGHTSIYSKQFR